MMESPEIEEQDTGCGTDPPRVWLWLLGLWLGGLLFYYPVIFGGQSFWMRDTMFVYYPQAMLTRTALLAGELPLWEPRIGTGYPFHADPHSMIFYPPAWLLLLLPMPRAYDLLVVLHVPLMGTFLFLLLRRWRLSCPAAALGAATAMFCGYTASVTCLTTLLKGTTWAPLAVLAFDGFLATGLWRHLALTALVLGIQGSGTDPQYVLLTTLLLATACWLRPLEPRPSGWRCLAGVGGAGTLALGLLAYQYLPLAELIANSNRAAGLGSGMRLLFDVLPGNLYNLALPLPVPDARNPAHLGSYAGAQSPFYPDFYFGLPVLALALTSLAWLCPRARAGRTEPRGTTAAWTIGLCAFSVLLALGSHTPIFGLVEWLVPPLEFFRYPGKYLLFTGLGVGLAAALGLEGLRSGSRVHSRWLGVTLGVGALLTGGLLMVSGTHGEQLVRWYLGWGAASTPGQGLIVATVCAGWREVLMLSCGICAGLAGLMFLHERGKLGCDLAVMLVGAVSLADLAATTRAGLSIAPDDVLAGSDGAARIVASTRTEDPFPRFVSASLRELSVDGLKSEFDHYRLSRELLLYMRASIQGSANLLQTMSVSLATGAGLNAMMAASPPALKASLALAAGAKFGLAAPGWTDELPGGHVTGRHGPITIRDLGDECPRVFIAPRAIGTSSEATLPSTELLLALPKVAVFEAPGTEELRPRAILDCRLGRYARNALEVEVGLYGEGLLVVLDTFYPGWEAHVDGRPREIVKVAGLFRGVRVRQGDRRVEMSYRPVAFRTGAAISLGFLAALLGLALGRRSRLTA